MRHFLLHTLSVVVLCLLPASPRRASSQPANPPAITIVRPTHGAQVEAFTEVHGKISGKEFHDLEIWLVVHPLGTIPCWTQGPALPRADGSWTVHAQFGEPDKHHGKKYEMVAFARDPKKDKRFPVGEIACWPHVAVRSDLMGVQRAKAP